ncbi:MAG TPA: alpha/beta fold hydrolase [Galbitalea sp.]|jgi:pimeloyl-ACP methyl ester carboxylesterase
MSDDEKIAQLPSGIELCYRMDGASSGRPLVLIAGLGLDLTSWPTAMIDGLVDAGFRIIRFDNRDVGRSTHVRTPPPGRLRQLLARSEAEDYDLGDMAEDVVGLLDELRLAAVDLVGMSLGGMIAQTVAEATPLHPSAHRIDDVPLRRVGRDCLGARRMGSRSRRSRSRRRPPDRSHLEVG